MPKAVDISEQRFGRLTALYRFGMGKWFCKCDCGNLTSVELSNLKANTNSCGCRKREGTHVTHGHAGKKETSEYISWRAMKSRCLNPNDEKYEYYGGGGVTIYHGWAESFALFLRDMGLKPSPKHTIDRINPFGNYEPQNCKWSTRKEQRDNQRAAYA